MTELRFTLVGDGPTDAVLLHPLKWLLMEKTGRAIEGTWAELRLLPRPVSGLSERIAAAVELFPCDLLFVHRDSEREPREHRITEIREAMERQSRDPFDKLPYVCVVPIRMTEAWLLFDETAIRRAAGNPHGTVPLDLPPIARVEDLPDPKEKLHDALKLATEKPERRIRRFRMFQAVQRVAELIDDYGALRSLSAFQALEDKLVSVLDGM